MSIAFVVSRLRTASLVTAFSVAGFLLGATLKPASAQGVIPPGSSSSSNSGGTGAGSGGISCPTSCATIAGNFDGAKTECPDGYLPSGLETDPPTPQRCGPIAVYQEIATCVFPE